MSNVPERLAPPPGWTASVVRLGGHAALDGAPGSDLGPALVSAWVAVSSPPVAEGLEEDDDPGVDPDLLLVAQAVARLLGRTPRPWLGVALEEALDAAPLVDHRLAAAHVARLAHALVAALVAGHLPAGGDWAVDIEDTTGAAVVALPSVLDLLGGVADGWDPTLTPPTITTNLGRFVRQGAGYRPVGEGLPAGAAVDVHLYLQHDRAPGSQLPSGRPAVVVRAVSAHDPGPPEPPGPPRHPEPARRAAARWCFGVEEPDADMLAEVGGLFDGSWPAIPLRPSSLVGETWRVREAADLVLEAWPTEPAALCLRAQVEAMVPDRGGDRIRPLVDAVLDLGEALAAAEPLRGLARNLRGIGRHDVVLDLWASADGRELLLPLLEEDVLDHPHRSQPAELAVVQARRFERAGIATARLLSGQDGPG